MKRISRTQRLARHEEVAVVKRIFWLSVISVVLIVVIFTVGIPFLGKFADLLDRLFKNNNTATSQESAILQPPVLDSLPTSTNQDTITISGFSNNSSKVAIYNNGEKIDEVNVDSGRFEFRDFRLTSGENRILAKSVSADAKSSDPSEEAVVTLDKKAPELEVTTPTEGQTFVQNNKIKVSGKSEKDAQVFASGFLANVNGDGNFEVTIPLAEGENKIEVKAVDDAGNTSTREVKVNFRK